MVLGHPVLHGETLWIENSDICTQVIEDPCKLKRKQSGKGSFAEGAIKNQDLDGLMLLAVFLERGKVELCDPVVSSVLEYSVWLETDHCSEKGVIR